MKMVCDVCNAEVTPGSSYYLTTAQVVLNRRYWQHILSLSEQIGSPFNPSRDELNEVLKMQVRHASGQSTAWAVCEKCAELFEFDRNLARGHAVRQEQPPGCGPVSARDAERIAATVWKGAPGQSYPRPVGGSSPSQTGGLAPNIAAMLSYLLFGWIGGLIMYLTQKDREVCFHAAQSILTFGGLAIISVFLNIVNSLTGSSLVALLSLFVSLLAFALWIFLSIQGYQLKHTKLPIVGDIAEQWAMK